MPWLSSAAAAPRAHRAPPCRARPRVLSSVLGHAPHWQRGNKVRRGREHCRAALQTCTSDLHFRFALQTCTSDFRAAIFSDFRAALQGCTSGLHFIQTCTSFRLALQTCAPGNSNTAKHRCSTDRRAAAPRRRGSIGVRGHQGQRQRGNGKPLQGSSYHLPKERGGNAHQACER